MPISVEMMKAASRAGMSIVCSSCELYWQARERDVPADRCLSQHGCGSPFIGDCFHEYRGIMTADAFKSFCFVCGADATHCLNRPTWKRSMGMCREHVGWMHDPKMRNPDFAGLPQKDGDELPPANTLLGAMLRTEKEWAEEDGREFDQEAATKELCGEKEPDVESLDGGDAEV